MNFLLFLLTIISYCTSSWWIWSTSCGVRVPSNTVATHEFLHPTSTNKVALEWIFSRNWENVFDLIQNLLREPKIVYWRAKKLETNSFPCIFHPKNIFSQSVHFSLLEYKSWCLPTTNYKNVLVAGFLKKGLCRFNSSIFAPPGVKISHHRFRWTHHQSIIGIQIIPRKKFNIYTNEHHIFALQTCNFKVDLYLRAFLENAISVGFSSLENVQYVVLSTSV